MSKTRILVTGSSGFIGKYLCNYLYEHGYDVIAPVRKPGLVTGAYKFIKINDIVSVAEWEEVLEGVDIVLHLAAYAYLFGGISQDSAEFYRVNTIGTQLLAKAAVRHKAKSFIFISSVKVNGEYTKEDSNGRVKCFCEDSLPDPQDCYALSKWEAEKSLREISKETGLNIVILRVPLVYGEGVKGSFLSLLRLVESGIPLPFSGIKNKRSFLYLGNLADAICACIGNPVASGNTFLVSDGQDISTPELIRIVAKAMGRKVPIFYFPVTFLKMLGKIFGKSSQVSRLTNSLCVDSGKITAILSWKPPFTLEEGMRLTAGYYKSDKEKSLCPGK